VSFLTDRGSVNRSRLQDLNVRNLPQPRQLPSAAADRGRYSRGPGPHPFLITTERSRNMPGMVSGIDTDLAWLKNRAAWDVL